MKLQVMIKWTNKRSRCFAQVHRLELLFNIAHHRIWAHTFEEFCKSLSHKFAVNFVLQVVQDLLCRVSVSCVSAPFLNLKIVQPEIVKFINIWMQRETKDSLWFHVIKYWFDNLQSLMFLNCAAAAEKGIFGRQAKVIAFCDFEFFVEIILGEHLTAADSSRQSSSLTCP